MSDFHEQFAKRLKERRRDAHLSQREVGSLAGVSSEFVSRMERGLTLPALETFVRVCAALGTTPNELLLERPYSSEMEALSARLSSGDSDAAKAALHAAEAILAYEPPR